MLIPTVWRRCHQDEILDASGVIAGAPLRNEDLRGYETHSQSELVVHEDGTCVVDGVPTDFVSMLRDKVRPDLC